MGICSSSVPKEDLFYEAQDMMDINPGAAIQLLKQAADYGHGGAQAVMARILMEGKIISPDFVQAVHYSKAAADQGVTRGMLIYGQLRMSGYGIDKDEQEGLEMIRKAADAGNARAQVFYAQELKLAAKGDKESAAESVKYFKMAAEQKDMEGQTLYGLALIRGEGIDKDEQSGMTYLRSASSMGYAKAKSNLNIQLVSPRRERQSAGYYRSP